MNITDGGSVIDCNFLQNENAYAPIFMVFLFPEAMDKREVEIDFSIEGFCVSTNFSSTLHNFSWSKLHFPNAKAPISRTLSGIYDKLANFVQPWKEKLPIIRTVGGMVKDFNDVHDSKQCADSTRKHELSSIVTSSKPELAKALKSILLTERGIMILFNFLQPSKHSRGITVIVLLSLM